MNFSPLVKHREELNKTKPALAFNGEDLTAWQTSARAKLIELIGLENFVACDLGFEIVGRVEKDGYTEYEYKIETEKNFFITSKFLIPTGAVNAPLAISLYGDNDDLEAAFGKEGFEDRDVCLTLVKKGYAVLALEMRSFGDCPGIASTRVPKGGNHRVTFNLCYRATMRANIIGRITVGERIFDIQRSIQAIGENFDCIDASNVTLLGNSGCGTVAFYCAAVDTRIKHVIASSGIAEWVDSLASAPVCSCFFIPYIANYFNPSDIAGLIAPRKLDMLSFSSDWWFTTESATSVFRKASAIYTAAGNKDGISLTKLEGEPLLYSSVVSEKI